MVVPLLYALLHFILYSDWLFLTFILLHNFCRAQWLRGRTSDSRLRGPGFESYAAVLKPRARFFTLHCSSSLSCINEYLAIGTAGYVYEQHSRLNCSIWLDVSQTSWDGVWLNRSIREVKCKTLWAVLMDWLLSYITMNICTAHITVLL